MSGFFVFMTNSYFSSCFTSDITSLVPPALVYSLLPHLIGYTLLVYNLLPHLIGYTVLCLPLSLHLLYVVSVYFCVSPERRVVFIE